MFNIFLFDYILNDISEINILSKCMDEFLFCQCEGIECRSDQVRSVWPRKEFTMKAFNLSAFFQCNF